MTRRSFLSLISQPDGNHHQHHHQHQYQHHHHHRLFNIAIFAAKLVICAPWSDKELRQSLNSQLARFHTDDDDNDDNVDEGDDDNTDDDDDDDNGQKE